MMINLHAIIGFAIIQAAAVAGLVIYKKINPDGYRAYQMYVAFIEVLSVLLLFHWLFPEQ